MNEAYLPQKLPDIYVDLVAPQAALNVLNALEGSIMGLDSLPFRFRKYEHEPWRSKGLHGCFHLTVIELISSFIQKKINNSSYLDTFDRSGRSGTHRQNDLFIIIAYLP